MMMAFRSVAIAIVLAGIVDPSFQVRRPVPVPVDIRSTDVRASGDADRVRHQLKESLRDSIDTSGRAAPAAVVLVGERILETNWPDGVPISTVSRANPTQPGVRIARINHPESGALRQSIGIEAELEAIGMASRSTTIALERRGIAVGKIDHRWTSDRERFTARFRYAPPAAGLHTHTVRVSPSAGERDAGTAADVDVVVEDRPLRVLIYEPRPSWSATFVRRALEADERFDVDSLARASRSFTARGGDAPLSLRAAERLSDFDVVIVGAPEALRVDDVEALTPFARVRGGRVVLLPDRRIGIGPAPLAYAPLIGGAFEELLLENPTSVANDIAPQLRASEFILPKAPAAGAEPLATVRQNNRDVSVAWIRSAGAGRVLFWGAADAWRFRADTDAPFDRFWQSLVADLAMQAPPRVAVATSPRRVRPGEPFQIRAAVRSTEWRSSGDAVTAPPVSARIVSVSGGEEHVRLWPVADAGVFTGRARAATPGTYDIHVTAGDASADTVLHVADDARPHAAADGEGPAFVASATGGVAATPADLEPLRTHLRSLAAATELRTVRPMQSSWWLLPMAGCLCIEWALRRRRGLR